MKRKRNLFSRPVNSLDSYDYSGEQVCRINPLTDREFNILDIGKASRVDFSSGRFSDYDNKNTAYLY